MSDSSSLSASRQRRNNGSRLWGSTDLLMLAMVLIWGVNYSVIKYCMAYFSPFAFNALRFSMATLVMLAMLLLRGETLLVPRRDLPGMAFLALTGHVLYQVVFINGLALTSAANTSLLLATMPIFAAIFAHVLHLERASALSWAGILLSFAGVLLLIAGSGAAIGMQASNLTGNLLILTGAMLWAAYATASRPMLARHTPLKVAAMQMLLGTPILVLLGWPGLAAQNWAAVPRVVWGGILYNAVISTAVAYVIYGTGIQRAGSTRTAVYSNATTVVAVLVAWVLLGDRLAPLQLLGAAVVFCGLVLTRRGRVSAPA